jgi:hypothetical protein
MWFTPSSTHLERAYDRFTPPKTTAMSRASMMVFTPIVSATFGMSSIVASSPNFSIRVTSVSYASVFGRVTDCSDDPGSLCPISPSLPVPRNMRSMPPAAKMRFSYLWVVGGGGGGRKRERGSETVAEITDRHGDKAETRQV